MKKALYIFVLLVLLAASVSGIALLVYPEFDTDRTADGTGPSVAQASRGPASSAGNQERVEPVVYIRPPREEPEEAPPVHDGPRLYLILDDGGHSTDDLRHFSRFGGVFTVAMLPGLPDSYAVSRMAHALGHELILHQPMEPLGPEDPGPGAIYTADSDLTIRSTLQMNMELFPEIVGVNNHMGSKATSDPRVMAAVAALISEKGLFFLDSRTVHTSIADEVAGQAGLPRLKRDVFLDNIRTEEAISAQLDEALEIARERGSAVMIGHLTSHELARVITRRYDEIVAAGYRFFPLRDLAAREVERLAHEDPGN